jgi:maltooligosyltrehalose trehalohydrolase
MFGPLVTDKGTSFRLWAPNADAVSLQFPDQKPLALAKRADGFFEIDMPSIGAGQRYRFDVAGQQIPDPASRLQDDDLFGWSVVRAPQTAKRDRRPPPWHDAVIAEIHLGTVSPEGTYQGLAKRLPHFVEAGYSALELMPIADFPGKRNWGYDGVLPFAPDRSYGSDDDLRALIEAAHALGLAVILDVVYNHFGPSGNFLHLYAEDFFTSRFSTPWGAAINLANPVVRRFFVENARLWIADYGFDGLRLDAVHAFATDGGDLLLSEIAAAVRAALPEAYLILENDKNEIRWLARDGGSPNLFTAQWNDDFHHVFHVLGTGEQDGYYEDYRDDPIAEAGSVLTEGFLYQGQSSPHRQGQSRGEISKGAHPSCFISFLQNHDQIGNRALGDRLGGLITRQCASLLQFILLLSPQIPMSFMGEEFGAIAPFQFFCDFDGDLADAVRNGRRNEFKSFAKFGGDLEIPDPNSVQTFEACKLDWDTMDTPNGQETLARFRALIELRRRFVMPLLAGSFQGATVLRQATAIKCQWMFADGTVALAANLSDGLATLDHSGIAAPLATEGEIAFLSTEIELGPWSGLFWSPQ